MTGTFWGLYNQNIHYQSITKDWNILSAAWKFIDSDKVHSSYIKAADPSNDREVCIALRNAIYKADIVCAHNGDAFDMKKLNARLIFHGIDPIPQKPAIDTLKEARKIAKFSSNKLDYLGRHFGVGHKMETPNDLWKNVMGGCKQSIRLMAEYNRQDVLLLEAVYMKLRGYMKTHPVVSVLKEGVCRRCGSHNTVKDGSRLLASGKLRQRIKCNDCGGYTTNEK